MAVKTAVQRAGWAAVCWIDNIGGLTVDCWADEVDVMECGLDIGRDNIKKVNV